MNEVTRSDDGLYNTAFGVAPGAALLWIALLLYQGGAKSRAKALRAFRRLGGTLCVVATALTLLALTLAVGSVASGVPVPEVMRPIGLMLCSGIALLVLGRWTLRRGHTDDEEHPTAEGIAAG